ncbi:MAG TPA: GIY-YIG nuclease family protein [Roseiarcus sp.]|nr:GIY-YIG nuclease family protein [Roseiarcus sp.]
MAGLVPAIHAPMKRAIASHYVTIAPAAHVIHSPPMRRGGWVYIMTNRPNGTLYTGVTSNIARRAFEHREGRIEGFTKQYGLRRLVFMEFYEDIRHRPCGVTGITRRSGHPIPSATARLVAAIRAALKHTTAWMPGTRPGMTVEGDKGAASNEHTPRRERNPSLFGTPSRRAGKRGCQGSRPRSGAW